MNAKPSSVRSLILSLPAGGEADLALEAECRQLSAEKYQAGNPHYEIDNALWKIDEANRQLTRARELPIDQDHVRQMVEDQHHVRQIVADQDHVRQMVADRDHARQMVIDQDYARQMVIDQDYASKMAIHQDYASKMANEQELFARRKAEAYQRRDLSLSSPALAELASLIPSRDATHGERKDPSHKYDQNSKYDWRIIFGALATIPGFITLGWAVGDLLQYANAGWFKFAFVPGLSIWLGAVIGFVLCKGFRRKPLLSVCAGLSVAFSFLCIVIYLYCGNAMLEDIMGSF